jgi:hypothetical protein
MQSSYRLTLSILLQTKRAYRVCQFFPKRHDGHIGQKRLIELFNPSFEVPINEDDIFTPKHDIETS